MNLAAAAADRDAADPLSGFRSRFSIPDPDLVYLDGNSLGPLPRRTRTAIAETVDREWAGGLVRSWDRWLDLGTRAGAALAPLIGARPDEVALCDQTSVNLYKLAEAAIGAEPSRPDIVTDADNFPSDRYILHEVARRRGGRLRDVPADPTVTDIADALDQHVGLVSLSLVNYRSGALADLRGITALAHQAGARVLWDLSHAAGIVPVDLADADLAVGCTYKYLNGGPGSPAFLYVRRDLQGTLTQPIAGWWSHDDMFAFEAGYRPAPDIRRFLTGTAPIVSMIGAAEGIALCADAGIDAIRAKSRTMTSWFIELANQRLAALGFEMVTPTDDDRRGGHVALRHDAAWPIVQALRDRNVIVDFRHPGIVRYGFSPLYNRYRDVAAAIERTADVVASGRHEAYPDAPAAVT